MELTVQDIISQTATVYEEGPMDRAPNFYKNAIPSSRYTEKVSDLEIQKGKAVEVLFDVAKKVSILALVIIPTFSNPLSFESRKFLFVASALVGIFVALSNEQSSFITMEENKDDYYKTLEDKGKIYACLPEENKNRYLTLRTWDLAFSSLLHGVASALEVFQTSFLGEYAAIRTGYSLGKQSVSLLFYTIRNAQPIGVKV